MADITLGDLEYAGNMKFRFVTVEETDYQSGISFVPNDVNLNRFQNVIVNVATDEATVANYHEGLGELKVINGSSELANGSSVTLEVTAIGR